MGERRRIITLHAVLVEFVIPQYNISRMCTACAMDVHNTSSESTAVALEKKHRCSRLVRLCDSAAGRDACVSVCNLEAVSPFETTEHYDSLAYNVRVYPCRRRATATHDHAASHR